MKNDIIKDIEQFFKQLEINADEYIKEEPQEEPQEDSDFRYIYYLHNQLILSMELINRIDEKLRSEVESSEVESSEA